MVKIHNCCNFAPLAGSNGTNTINMKKKLTILLSTTLTFMITTVSLAQDTIHNVLPHGYDPNHDKIIPDKVFEIGLPLLFLFMLVNSIVTIFKIRAENRLKEKVLDKQVSDATLVTLFAEDKSLARYSYLKWFLILAALGVSFIIIPRTPGHGYMALGMISLLLSFAFLAYFLIIRKK